MFPFLFAPPIFSQCGTTYAAHYATYLNGCARMSNPIFNPSYFMPMPDYTRYVGSGNNNGNNNSIYGDGGFYGSRYGSGNGNSSGSNSTSTGEGTATEKANARTCKDLLDQVKKYPELATSYKNIIEDAFEQAKDKKQASEKLAIYKEAIEKIGFDTIKDILTAAPVDKFEGEYYKELSAAGYEYADTETDEGITELNSALSKLGDSTGNADESVLDGLVQYDAYSNADVNHILDIVSSWNTRYGKKDDENRRIITLIGDRYLQTDDEKIKEDIKDLVLTKYIDALINKANDVKKNLSGEAKGKMQAAINSLRKVADNDDTYDNEEGIKELSNKFDTLYLLLRQATISIVTDKIKDKYSIIADIINDDPFKEDTVDDLKEEGFTTDEIKNTVVKVNRTHSDSEEITAEEKVENLVSDDYLTETELEYQGNKVYQENEKTGGRDYQRVFIVKDNDIKELKNAKIENGQIVKVESDKDITEKAISESTIRKNVDKVREEKAKNEETQESGNKPVKPVHNSNFDAKLKGKEVGEMLRNWTTKDDTKDINQNLGKVSKNNVLDFLRGYYQGEEKLGKTEGLIEHLDDDNDGGNIEMKNKKNLIKSVLAKAESLHLEDSDNYKKLKSYFEKYEGKNAKDSCKDRKDFDKNKGFFKNQDGKRLGSIASWAGGGVAAGALFFAIGAIPGIIVSGVVGAVIGLFDQVTDNEVMDKALEGLYKEMLAQEVETPEKTEKTKIDTNA